MWSDKYETLFLSKAEEPEGKKSEKTLVRDICEDDIAANLLRYATLCGVPSL